MTRTRIYLIMQAILCVLLVVLLSLSAVTIYREGAARKAEHPLESIYTREIAAEKFAPIAPLFFAAIGLMIAGLVLGVRDENADKAVEAPELKRDLIVERVSQPSDDMRRAQSEQKRWLLIGWTAFALCMIPVLIYVLNPDHFPLADLEGMFYGLIRVLIPWTAVGIGALAVTSGMRERVVLRETEAAQAQIKAEKEAGVRPEPKAAPRAGSVAALQIALVVIAIGLIVAGVINGSARDVLYKAINICTECVGLG
jgi:hypothetical protein